jgi:hypothetical protein
MAKRYYTLMMEPELAQALKVLKQRDGIPEAEQIRRALRIWFRRKNVKVAEARPRARKRR